jgi:hypothetical protein
MGTAVMPKRILAAILLVSAITCHAKERAADSGAWVSGFWHITADETQDSLGEIIEFRPDQTVVLWDSSCNSQNIPEELNYHVERGDIYITNHLTDKDHVSLSLHPSRDKTELILTWPETGRNATFTRMSGEGCPEEQRDPPLDPSPDLDLSVIAKQYNVPQCEVSVPLTQKEALRIAERDGGTHVADRPDWAAMAKEFHVGDQLRQVVCLKAGQNGMAAGDVFFGLFRGGKMIADIHTIIIN